MIFPLRPFSWKRQQRKKSKDLGPDVAGVQRAYYRSGHLAALVNDQGHAYVWPIDNDSDFCVKLEGFTPAVLRHHAELILLGRMGIA